MAPADSRCDAPVVNVFTVDLEDWPIAVVGPEQPVTERVVANTERCLALFAEYGVRATFFVLTKVAARFPELIRAVRDAGHEIASHGHGHELLTRLTPGRFREDVRRSIDVLTETVGERPIGYRAPGFSVVDTTWWAAPILHELGFEYSSSVFPIRHRRYGIPGAPRHVHRWSDCGLVECPVAAIRLGGRNWPIAGGGYFRLLPGAIVRASVRRLNREGLPAVLYMHPYELDAGGVGFHKRCGVPVGVRRHMTQELFRDRFEARLRRLFESFRFEPLRDMLGRGEWRIANSE